MAKYNRRAFLGLYLSHPRPAALVTIGGAIILLGSAKTIYDMEENLTAHALELSKRDVLARCGSHLANYDNPIAEAHYKNCKDFTDL